MSARAPDRTARRARRARRLGAAACLLLAVGAGHAAGRLDAIRQRGVLVVGVKTDYPPFGMLTGDARQEGFETDLAADLARRLGVPLRTAGVTGVNRLQALNDGRVDVTIATIADTAQRRQIATLIEPDYYSSGATLMTRADSTVKTWADIRGKTVCATQASYFNRPMATRYLLTLEIYGSGRDAKLAVRDGRCIGWLFDNTAIAGDLRAAEWHGYRIALPTVLPTPWAIAIARTTPDDPLGRLIGDAVADWHREGTLIALERKWGLPPSAFLADMHALWSRRTADGRYLCTRQPDGSWPVACRNPAFVTSAGASGLRRWGMRLDEITGINLTYLYDDYERAEFLHALALTGALTLCCITGSVLCGIALALAAACGTPALAAPLRALARLARTTPPLLQIYVLMFGIGSVAAARWDLHFNAFWIVVLSLSVYTGAGLMRTLDDAVRHERRFAPGFTLTPATLGRMLGHSSTSIVALLVNVTKATMMAGTVAVPELLSVSTSIVAEHGNTATMMNTLMLCFLLLVFAVVRLLRWIERGGGDGRR
ncbi:transporter substrate-binding domain-containing protein [Burkholderia alba]|uniref:transporter substrate-binding domain-containing protein n=1 Tax=Burkholderia alba TaxID=2683677 RepID=UPI002B051E63|nr:transporter substrate-binding domain-containing protein [Burkholderia alba]